MSPKRLKVRPSTGDWYGRWVVIDPADHHPRAVLCRRNCGKERLVDYYRLLSGTSRSCGCGPSGDKIRRFIKFEDRKMTLSQACRLAGVLHGSVAGRARLKCFSYQEAFDYFVGRKQK